MENINTAFELIELIKNEKNSAIKSGLIRKEKPLKMILNKEITHKLPDKWLWVRLGDYALKITDYVASGSFASLKENVLITNEPNYAIMVKTADFSNNFTKNLTYTDKHGYEFLNNSNLFGGELILSNIGSIGKVFIVPYLDRPMTLASNTIMIKLTDDRLVKYLYYYFISPLGQKTLKEISSGTSMMKFNKTQLKNILIPVAPPKEQNYIVTALERTELIINAKKRQLKKLDELISGRFVELFGNLDINDKGWNESSLGEACDKVVRYPTFYGMDYLETGTRVIRIGNILEDGHMELADENYVFVYDGVNEDFPETVMELNDIVMAVRGDGSAAKRIAIIREEELIGSNISPNLIRIKAGKELEPLFLFYYLTGDVGQRRLDAYVNKTAKKNIAAKDIVKVIVPIPPLLVQKQFTDFVHQVDKSKLCGGNYERRMLDLQSSIGIS